METTTDYLGLYYSSFHILFHYPNMTLYNPNITLLGCRNEGLGLIGEVLRCNVANPTLKPYNVQRTKNNENSTLRSS